MFEKLKNVLITILPILSVIAIVTGVVWALFHIAMGFLIIKHYIGTFWAVLVSAVLAFFGIRKFSDWHPINSLLFAPALVASYFGMTILLDWHPIKALIIIFAPYIFIILAYITFMSSLSLFYLFKYVCVKFFNR